MDRRPLVVAAVGGHFLLTVLHGLVHAAVPVLPSGRTAVVAAVSLYVLPVAGVWLAVTGRRRLGAVALLLAGVTGFAVEAALHFLLSNPDHVAHVAERQAAFGVTAVLTTLGDLLLVVAAGVAVRRSSVTASR